MSQPGSNEKTVVLQKPRSNVYTMMLVISLIATITASLLLYWELNRYGTFPQWKTGPGAVTN